ncbi:MULTISPECIES: TolC family protein [Stenotrophomonas]|uniref:TolC family protein n=2 Tax=Stenotrophomonas TaxID=40323 RepID=A0A246KYF2_9GAMM|nr:MULTISPECIES: TolC family protein [Stenotrophomonas]KMU64694.1 Heavy metal RND efflux outer membrane protein, CzcC family [Stenotrophomonas maltophilia]MDQ7271658.1 TolC family protein [Stenotrophomonas sp. Sm3212]CCH12674.1 Heavy metal RND efflux outer membrane protein,CzcC family [Stenotrophomonas maltophilia D457]MCW8344059.1 TolC family protein [Stenotrophomonas sp. SG1]OWR33601.1 TolC family protein [Stenotrophomonas pavanii]
MLAIGFMVTPAWSIAAGISFNDAQRLAAERAPLLKARQSQIAATQEEAVRAAALPDPKLTLGLTNWPVTGADAFDFRADDMTMKQIGVMQAFPARAKRQARQAVADRGIEQAEALSVAEQLAVQRGTAEAWIALWAAQREVAALQTLREPASIAVHAAKGRLTGATGTVTDTLATQAAALELENRIDAALAALEAARAGLARWLGVDPVDVEAEDAPPELTELPVDPATLLASIDSQGPLLPWRSREALAEAEVDAAIAEKRPDWSLGVTYGQRDRMPNGVSRSDMLMVEFAIDLPLFPRNRQDRGVAARRAELDAVAAEREDARRVQTEAVRRTLADWQGLQRQVARKETQSLPLAHDRAKSALAAYAGGGDLQPWLEARRDEIALHIEHARHLGELGRAWAALAYLLPEESTP